VRADAAFAQDLEKAGAEMFTHPEPERFVSEEVARWNDVINATGFKTQ